MVPLWQHVAVIVVLLFTHGMTALWALRTIRDLRGALECRDVLLDVGDIDKSTAWIGPGGTMVVMVDTQPVKRIRIWSKLTAQLRVTFE